MGSVAGEDRASARSAHRRTPVRVPKNGESAHRRLGSKAEPST